MGVNMALKLRVKKMATKPEVTLCYLQHFRGKIRFGFD